MGPRPAPPPPPGPRGTPRPRTRPRRTPTRRVSAARHRPPISSVPSTFGHHTPVRRPRPLDPATRRRENPLQHRPRIGLPIMCAETRLTEEPHDLRTATTDPMLADAPPRTRVPTGSTRHTSRSPRPLFRPTVFPSQRITAAPGPATRAYPHARAGPRSRLFHHLRLPHHLHHLRPPAREPSPERRAQPPPPDQDERDVVFRLDPLHLNEAHIPDPGRPPHPVLPALPFERHPRIRLPRRRILDLQEDLPLHPVA